MLRPIHFHNQLRPVTRKINDVTSEWLLSPKMNSGLLKVAQFPPQQLLGISGVLA